MRACLVQIAADPYFCGVFGRSKEDVFDALEKRGGPYRDIACAYAALTHSDPGAAARWSKLRGDINDLFTQLAAIEIHNSFADVCDPESAAHHCSGPMVPWTI